MCQTCACPSPKGNQNGEMFDTICVKRPILQKSKTTPFHQIIHPKVLIYIKPWDEEVFCKFSEISKYILQQSKSEHKLELLVEQWLHDLIKESKCGKNGNELNWEDFQVFNQQEEEKKNLIQYLITLGGDGTVLYAAKQFHGSYIPPIIGFSSGSLGYLCNFEFEEYKAVLQRVLFSDFLGDESRDPSLDLRMRLKLDVLDKPLRKVYKGVEFKNFQEILIQDYHVVNEVVIDRGPSPYCIQVEIYIDGHYFTNCVGDGLIVSTPAGSTAYNLAAGGSIVQSSVPAILLTPLAPHSLSFRPLILPENCSITLKKPADGRTSAWVSVDGATRFELFNGESIVVSASPHAIAFVTNPTDNLTQLWSQKLTKLLNWNTRPYMKPLRKKDIQRNME